ncbi:hypothetical protein [Dietzia sp. MNB45]|uniref:hypothetical protein n=1 Tax=Dietzia sp. MNB45 TaxID=3238800 RepID=UPI003F7CDB0D
MKEEFKPNQEQPRRVYDDELVTSSIEQAASQERGIDDATSRMIATMLHTGQTSAMYAFASTGEITPGLQDEIDRELLEAEEAHAEEIAIWMRSLSAYVASRETPEAIDGWGGLWLEQPSTAVEAEPAADELSEAIRQKFLGVSTPALIRRLEAADDFGADDEEYELNRRLSAEGKTWRWAGDFYRPHVEIVEGEG